MVSDPNRPDIGEIVSTRHFGLSIARVFRAFSDPVELAAWWGPQGFTNSFQVFEFRPGGAWKFTMRGPDGAVYAMDKQFLEIVPRERIVVRHLQAAHEFVLIMAFLAQGEGTEVTWRMRFEDPAEGARLRDFLLKANDGNFDRLAAHLAGKLSAPPGVIR